MNTIRPESNPAPPDRPAASPWPPRRIVVGLWLAALLTLLFWAAFHAFGAVVLALAVWFLAEALPGERERRAVRGLLFLLAAVWIVHTARWVVYPLLGGVLVALLLAPAADWLEARRVRRSVAVGLVLVPGALFVVLTLVLLVPAIIRQVQLVIEKLPFAYDYAMQHSGTVLRLLGRPAPEPAAPIAALADSLGTAVEATHRAAGADSAGAATAPGADLLRQLLGHTRELLGAALGKISDVGRGIGKVGLYLSFFFLTPVVAYHLMVDREWFRDVALRWLPSSWHPRVARVSRVIGTSLQTYLRGQFLVAGAEAVLFTIVFAVAGLPQPVALGVIAAILSLLPVLGFWIMAILVLLNGVTGPSPGATLLRAGIGIAVINVIEGQFLVPKIQGSGLKLHPLMVLLGVLFFGALFGFVGVILAVPAMSVIREILPDVEGHWRRSRAPATSPDQIDCPPGEE